MNLLLVLGSDDAYTPLAFYVKALGFDLIRYRYVLKAMDNLDEVNPGVIIISATDFPRHWKLLLHFIRSERSKAVCPVILLKGDAFSLEEASKAFYLGVNGLVAESLDTPLEVDRLQSILSDSLPVEVRRHFRRYYQEEWNRFGFLFSNPADHGIITGEVKAVSRAGLSFYPYQGALMRGLGVNRELPECSLRAGDAILAPICKLIHPGRLVLLEFISFPDNERAIFNAYLAGMPSGEII
ncbi:MAG: PilZ domain-containing protein [Treponema sp.]|jgi:hypothetical protein|nr:PilZ domain-containing protein [Treponema sp.]